MLLLVGLGNPGQKYAHNRHNVGFMAVDSLADAHGFGSARAKFQGEIREGRLGAGGKTLVLKPMTYMNDSGQSVGEAMRFFRLSPGDVVVFHDELDLAAGKLKVKTGGGVAGHNGLKSIAAHIGPDFRRVRIGIGHPGERARVSGHVLGDFAKADATWLEPLLDALAGAAPLLGEGDAAYGGAVGQKLAVNRPAPAARDRAPSKKSATGPATEGSPRGAEKAADAAASPFRDALKKLLPGGEN